MKEELMDKNPEEFTKKELMLMVFGKDGAVPGLTKKINKLCLSIDGLNGDIVQVRKDIRQYNGLKGDLIKVGEAIEEQKQYCLARQLAITTREETETKIADKIAKERADARKDERDSQNLRYEKQLRLIKFTALLIGVVTLFLTFGGMFWW